MAARWSGSAHPPAWRSPRSIRRSGHSAAGSASDGSWPWAMSSASWPGSGCSAGTRTDPRAAGGLADALLSANVMIRLVKVGAALLLLGMLAAIAGFWIGIPYLERRWTDFHPTREILARPWDLP